MPITRVGNELVEAHFGELLRSIAQGIADGQRALDLASINTLVVLAGTPVDIIPEVTELITPATIDVNVPGHTPVQVTGARVSASAAQPVQLSALQAGILPTFYQFTEVTIELKLSVQLREADQTDTDGSTKTGIFAFGSHVNFRTQNTFSYSVDAASTVTAIMRPVPPPARLLPSTITVNATGARPTVNVSP
jgi:hypothetical protein